MVIFVEFIDQLIDYLINHVSLKYYCEYVNSITLTLQADTAGPDRWCL